MQFRITGLLLLPALLAGCSYKSPDFFEEKDSGPTHQVDLSSIPDAQPRPEVRSRYGNPASYEVFGKRYYVMDSAAGYKQRGIASWYGNKFHGRRTSSGEPYNMYAMTAAHKSLPLPTYVEVTNLENSRKIVVKVNDRGPFHQNRIIDLSYVAAAKLGISQKGTGLVEVRAINPATPYRPQTTPLAAQNNANADFSDPRSQSPEKQPGLFIQAGAFKNRDNALRMKARLNASLENPVRISEASLGGSLVYRVQVGPLLKVEVADQVSLQLEDIGIINIKTVID